MENAGYMFATYAIIWVFFFGYLVFLHIRQRNLNRELESLENLVKEKEQGS